MPVSSVVQQRNMAIGKLEKPPYNNCTVICLFRNGLLISESSFSYAVAITFNNARFFVFYDKQCSRDDQIKITGNKTVSSQQLTAVG